MVIKLQRFQQSAPLDRTYKFSPALQYFLTLVWEWNTFLCKESVQFSQKKMCKSNVSFKVTNNTCREKSCFLYFYVQIIVSFGFFNPCWTVKALKMSCDRLLSRLSEPLSVFYRSQMGRSTRIKCIKCPLLCFMNGLKDLQRSVIRPSIIATPAWNLQHRL